MSLTSCTGSKRRHIQCSDWSLLGVQETRSTAATIKTTMTKKGPEMTKMAQSVEYQLLDAMTLRRRQGSQRAERRTSPERRYTFQTNCCRGRWRCCGSIGPTIIALVISVLLTLGSCASGLKVTVSIPELVKLNDAFWLNCSYNNQHLKESSSLATSSFNQQDSNGRPAALASSSSNSERIYSIKWYKDEEEFYRYLPSAEPKVSIYETNGISLDQTKSHEGNVYMTKADVNSEGVYRCEVLSEAPLFETVRKSKHLRVYALPIRGPRIEILDSNGRIKNPKAQEISFEVGDKIELRCNSAPSKPAARLRWYLNERELVVPSQEPGSVQQPAERANSRGSGGGAPAALLMSPAGQLDKQPVGGHNVRVSPIEHRQHYRNIYSSHSTLSLVLQRDDLINGRISFKCLASMRQEVPIESKQLYVLLPQHQLQPSAGAGSMLAAARIRARSTSELIGTSNNEAEPTRGPQQRHRAQYNRQPSSSRGQKLSSPSSVPSDVELINSLTEEARQETLMYVYEDADSTLGPSIIDSPETLDRYLASIGGLDSSGDEAGSLNSNNNNNNNNIGNYSLEFNRADNLEFVQLMRDKYSRQRSYPAGSSPGGAHSPAATAAGPSSSGNQHHHHHKRLYGPNSLVRSPLYLDEYDPFRPVISWPPLESGKLLLLPPSQTLVAIPTPSSSNTNRPSAGSQAELKFVMAPPSRAGPGPSSPVMSEFVAPLEVILHKLVESINCTCSEASIDTKLSWFVNEVALGSRDTRHYPTRISADHRQTWTTIGLLPVPHDTNRGSRLPPGPPSGLPAMLAHYYRKARWLSVGPTSVPSGGQAPGARLRQFDGSTNSKLIGGSQQQQQQQVPPGGGGPGNHEQQLTFMCQATHSMLLYSSSEMMTFDFNPPPGNQIDGGDSGASNSIDKFSSLPSNVIPAATASPTRSSSSPGWKSSLISLGSHQQFTTTSVPLLLLLLMPLLTTLACSHWRPLTINEVIKFA